jgi:indolepyruvate ferredoxin oxidoreductase beta subunit
MSLMRIFFTGVGGQGTLTATNLLAHIALDNDIQVIAGEIHGMAQRGGVVHSFVLLGGYLSPKISESEADILLGFEPLETLRALSFLKPEGVIVSSEDTILPISVATGNEEYPGIKKIKDTCRACAEKAYFLPCLQLASKTSVPQTANMVLLGALFASGLLPFDLDALAKGIKKHLKPKIVDVNLKAIELGADFITNNPQH